MKQSCFSAVQYGQWGKKYVGVIKRARPGLPSLWPGHTSWRTVTSSFAGFKR